MSLLDDPFNHQVQDNSRPSEPLWIDRGKHVGVYIIQKLDRTLIPSKQYAIEPKSQTEVLVSVSISCPQYTKLAPLSYILAGCTNLSHADLAGCPQAAQ